MESTVSADSLHRTAKLFMDNGQAQTHDEALAMLRGFGLTVYVGTDIALSIHHQTALLTLINVARRTFLAGVEVVGVPAARSLCPLAPAAGLRESVVGLGGKLVSVPRSGWPTALIGDVGDIQAGFPAWRVTWGGWRGGALPAREEVRLREYDAISLAPVLAASACAGEVFAYHAGGQAMAGRRNSGLSLWRPTSDWLADDPTEVSLGFLPSRVWIIGLGNLGQAFAWTLATLPYQDRDQVQITLQDFDRIGESNESTSVLSFASDVTRRKARVVGEWLERRGFQSFLSEHRFGSWTRRGEDEPSVALCGVDNPLARAALEKAGFGLVVEAGLGAGTEAFRSISVHTFPSSLSAEQLWSKEVGAPKESTGNMPAYQELKGKGMDRCGLTQLASRTVGVPFVGMIAGCLVVSELLRRLNSGSAFELLSGSAAALTDFESIEMKSGPYSFGHVNTRV